MEPRELYEKMFADELYTKSFEDFKAQYGSEAGQEKLWRNMSADKLYTKSLEDFREKYFGVKKKEDGVPASGAPVSGSAGAAAPVYSYSWGPKGGEQIKTPTGRYAVNIQADSQFEDSDATRQMVAKIDASNKYQELRNLRNGDYSSDAVSRMRQTEYEQQQRAAQSSLEEGMRDVVGGDVTMRQYEAQVAALTEDTQLLSKAATHLESKLMDTYGETVFEDFQNNIEEYEKLKRLHESGQTSEETVRQANLLVAEIEKMQSDPSFQELSAISKAVQMNVDRFKSMNDDDNYATVMKLIDIQKSVQKYNDGEASKLELTRDLLTRHLVGALASDVATVMDIVETKTVGDEKYGTWDKVEDWLRGVNSDAQLLMATPTQFSRPLFSKTAKWGEYEVDEIGGEKVVRKDGKVVPDFEGEIPDDLDYSTQFNIEVAPYQAGEMAADMSLLLTGAGVGQRGLQGLKLSESAASTISLTAATAGQMSTEFYDQGLKMFNGDKEKAMNYAIMAGVGIGLLNARLGPEKDILSSKAATSVNPATASVQVLKSFVSEGAEEGIFEPLVERTSQMMLGAEVEPLDWREMSGDFIMGGITGALFESGKQLNDYSAAAMIAATENLDKIREISDDAKLVDRIENVANKLEVAGDEMLPEDKIEAVKLFNDRANLEVEQQEARKAGIKVVEEQKKAEIEEKDKEIAAVVNKDPRFGEWKVDESTMEMYRGTERKPLSGKVAEQYADANIDRFAMEEDVDLEGVGDQHRKIMEEGSALQVGMAWMAEPEKVGPDMEDPSIRLRDEVAGRRFSDESLGRTRFQGEDLSGIKKNYGGGKENASELAESLTEKYGYEVTEEDVFDAIETNMSQGRPDMKERQNPLKKELAERFRQKTGVRPTDAYMERLGSRSAKLKEEADITQRMEMATGGSLEEPRNEGDKMRGLYKNVAQKIGGVEKEIADADPQFYEEMNQSEVISEFKEIAEKEGADVFIHKAKGDIIGDGRAMKARRIVARIMLHDMIAEARSIGDKIMEAKLRSDLSTIMKKSAKRGTETGQENALEAFILALNPDLDYNVDSRKEDYEELYGEMPEDTESSLREIEGRLMDVTTKLKEARERAARAEAIAAIAAIKSSFGRGGKPNKSTKSRAKDIAKAIRRGKTTKPGVFMAASPGALIWDAAIEVAATTVEAGGTVAQAVIDGVTYIKNSDWYKKLTEPEKMDAESSFRGHITGSEDPFSGQIPNSLIRQFVESGIEDIDQLVSAVREATGFEGSDRDIRDAITGYGRIVDLSKDEIGKKVRKLKAIGRTLSALEDVQAGVRPMKSGMQREKPDAEVRAMKKKLREAMKELPATEEAAENELLNRLEQSKNRLRNQIEDLNRQIKSGEEVKRSPKEQVEDEELKNLRGERDRVKAEWDKVFRDEKYIFERRLEEAKKRTQKAIDELNRRLKEGDFSKKKRDPLKPDKELKDLQAEKMRIQNEFDKEFFKAMLATRTRSQLAIDFFWGLWGLTRVLMATGELSFIGIQGLIQTIAHPIHAAKAFKNSIKFLFSEKKTEEWLADVKSQDWYPTLKNSKLALTEVHAEMRAREELYYSQYSDLIWQLVGAPLLFHNIPKLIRGEKLTDADTRAFDRFGAMNPLRALERGAVGYLDTLRVERFLQGMEKLEVQGKSFETHPQEYKDVADVINTMTGRASLGSLEQHSKVLSKLFFSPRNWAAQLKMTSPYAIVYFAKKTPTARRMMLLDFSKWVGFTTSMMMLAAVHYNNDDDDETGVELDPRSSDFMKIRLGRKRVDPWGGRIQHIYLSIRFIMDILYDVGVGEGGFKNQKGEILPLGVIGRSPSKYETVAQAALNKLAPSASILYAYMSKEASQGKAQKEGADYEWVGMFGDEFSLSEELKQSLRPIFWQTIGELNDDGFDVMDGILTTAAFFGAGVNVYEDTDKKKAEKAAKKEQEKIGKMSPIEKGRYLRKKEFDESPAGILKKERDKARKAAMDKARKRD